ncbi:MAG TPA: transcription termination/antitermination NusG family protein [Bryobacteraceae bacterium]|nr:transcription termination/antitermination NusG family protein [Bryobacteraceae bacterium]
MASSTQTSGSSSTARWFALTVRHQHERQTARSLDWKGLETLVPCYPTSHRWSDRVKEVETPLFAGYVFCRFELRERIRVLNTPGVARIVGFGGAPAALQDEEIGGIQAALQSRLRLWPWQYLRAGDQVRIERGPLRGVQGTLLREPEGLRLVIGVELLRRAVAVEVDPEMIAPLRLWEGSEASCPEKSHLEIQRRCG